LRGPLDPSPSASSKGRRDIKSERARLRRLGTLTHVKDTLSLAPNGAIESKVSLIVARKIGYPNQPSSGPRSSSRKPLTIETVTRASLTDKIVWLCQNAVPETLTQVRFVVFAELKNQKINLYKDQKPPSPTFLDTPKWTTLGWTEPYPTILSTLGI